MKARHRLGCYRFGEGRGVGAGEVVDFFVLLVFDFPIGTSVTDTGFG